jgi:pimeloyl-ACP methyl ester carboxylesterase
MHDPALAPRLDDLTVPTLVVWGTADGLLPVQLGTRWVQLLPDARLVLLEGAGHVPLLDRPAEFADLVTRFLDGPDWPAEAQPVDRALEAQAAQP